MPSKAVGRGWQCWAVALGCVACTGETPPLPAGSSGAPTAGAGSSGGGSGGAATIPEPTVSECASSGKIMPGPSPIRRLNRVEYNNTVSDLLKDNSAPADSFTLEEQSSFDNDANVLRVSRLLAEGYLGAAEALANSALSKPETLPCAATAALGDVAAQEACATQLIDTWGPKAYRRPLAAEERSRLLGTFRSARAFLDFNRSASTVLQTMLMSPQFLYRIESGAPVDGNPGVLKVDPWGLASRLSYFLWASTPDEALLAAANEGRLVTAADVRREAERMYGSPRSRAMVRRFTRHWLELTNVDQQGKDETLFPDYTAEIGALMRTQTETLAEHLYFDGGGTLGTMLTAPYSYMNKTLATFLGVTGPQGEAFEKVELDPTKHSGVLTEPAFLSYNATVDRTHPIYRGVFVMRQLLCAPPGAPPPGIVDGTESAAGPNPTQRERLLAHRTNPSCAACHERIDPIGLTFENFDASGRWQAAEASGDPVDASGGLVGTDVDGPVANAIELTQKLAQSAQVQKCVTVNWFRFANGRGEVMNDSCSIARVSDAVTNAGGDLRELVLSLTQTDAFLYRAAPGAEVTP
jgi:Protein of unknown function (DUF1592)/Protein of unknown function (DUF1588)/Protein of unknown function (DUF1595)/Protein of unknown function (DUF1587)/Protein of unknown function (DUF1585)